MLNLDPQLIEQSRTERVNKNFTQKREEKGLVTVFESANETDNRTTMGANLNNTTLNKESRGKGGQRMPFSLTGGPTNVISEEVDNNGEDDKGTI